MSEVISQGTITKRKNIESEDQGFMGASTQTNDQRTFLFHRATSANSLAWDVS